MSVIEKAFLSKIGAAQSGFVFRGQANSTWKLYSAATRRLIRYFNDDESAAKESHFSQMHLAYHRAVLIDPARKYGFDNDNGHRISDLQLLAKLQSFGAATGLLHFSRDPLVALWYASEENDCDGKVFVVDLNDGTDFRRISSEDAAKSVEEIFGPPGEQFRHPFFEDLVQEEEILTRLRKEWVSVLGCPLIPEDAVSSIVIKAADKPQIRQELVELPDFVGPAPFADVQRFSASNGATIPLPQIEDPKFHLMRGNQCFLQGNYTSAVSHYDRSIQLDPENGRFYFSRGNAKSEAGNFRGACEDYDAALRYELEKAKNSRGNAESDTTRFPIWRFYFNRGNVKYELNDFKGALEDYARAIREGKQTGERYSWFFLNKGNTNYSLHNYEEALSDFEEAIRLGHHDVTEESYQNILHNKGNLLVTLGRFDEALACYDESIRQGNKRSGVICNRNGVEAILTRIGMSGYFVRPPRYKDHSGRMTVEVSLRANANSMYTEFFNFLGLNGNTGNTGGDGLPGGKGLRGKAGFVVVVKGEEW